MLFPAILGLIVCGLYGSADDGLDQQLAALKTSMSPPISVPFSPFQTGRRPLGLPPQLEVMLPAVKNSVIQEVAAQAQGLISSERQNAFQQVASPKQPVEEDDYIFDFEME